MKIPVLITVLIMLSACGTYGLKDHGYIGSDSIPAESRVTLYMPAEIEVEHFDSYIKSVYWHHTAVHSIKFAPGEHWLICGYRNGKEKTIFGVKLAYNFQPGQVYYLNWRRTGNDGIELYVSGTK